MRLRNRSPRWWAGVALGLLSIAMLVGAVVFAGYPFYTDFRADRRQSQLASEFSSAANRKAFESGQIEEGAPLTRIVIARLGLDTIVVQGTSAKALRAGSGHYRNTPLPGEPGNVAIAGHSGMNGKPFDSMAKLRKGDVVELITPLARHVYQVTPGADGKANPWITDPYDWSVIKQSDEALLTLTTCHPRGSSKERLIARAKLLSSTPLS